MIFAVKRFASWDLLPAGGSLFHRFGRCPNHGDFLDEFICEGGPKLILVTLAPFGPPGKDSSDDPLLISIHIFTMDSIVILAFKRLAGIANSRFHIGFYSDICFRAFSWYSEFAFSLWIL